MSNTKTMSIYAEALISNREYKNAKIDGTAVGIANARNWSALVKACLIPAYTIRKYRYDNMGNKDTLAPCDQSALYAAIRPIIDLVGEVNGDKLNAHNVAEEFIAHSVRTRAIDITIDMADARCKYNSAKSALAKLEQGSMSDADFAAKVAELQADVTATKSTVADLEARPGNCKRIISIQSESAFVKAVELALGDAITKQTLRPVEDILAEKAAKKAERDAKRKANKLAKKQAK